MSGTPVRLMFKDPVTGETIHGVSEPVIDPNHFRINLNVKAYAPCKDQSHWGRDCNCEKELLGERDGPSNLCTAAWAGFVQANILNTAANPNIKDTGGTSRSLSANTAVSALTLVAGTGTAAASVADNALTTATAGASGNTTSLTISTATETGTSGSFTIVGTITNTSGGNINYAEVGLTITAATFVFLITHDIFTALTVSNNGTLQLTYTMTNS